MWRTSGKRREDGKQEEERNVKRSGEVPAKTKSSKDTPVERVEKRTIRQEGMSSRGKTKRGRCTNIYHEATLTQHSANHDDQANGDKARQVGPVDDRVPNEIHAVIRVAPARKLLKT